MPTYAEIPGFDLAKINDPNHVNDKYSPALRAFSEAMAAGIPLTRGNLAPQVDWAKSHGFGNAKQVGDDSIDYGDSRGPIDLIRGSDDATMFLDKAVWGNPSAMAPAPSPSPTSQAPIPAATNSTQSDLVRDAIIRLGGGVEATRPEAPIPYAPSPSPAPNPTDQILGNYDDLLQEEIRKQLQP